MSRTQEAIELAENIRKMKARAARCRKPICKGLNLEEMAEDVQKMESDVQDVLCMDADEITDLIGEDDWYELHMALTELNDSLCRLEESFYDDYQTQYVQDCFDQWTVMLAGKSYGMMGYDDYEDDWFDLDDFEQNIADEEMGKKLERMTKKELISTGQVCFGVALRYLGIRARFNDLQATIDIILGDQRGISAAVERINELYDEQFDEDGKLIGDWSKASREWNQLIDQLPERVWIE